MAFSYAAAVRLRDDDEPEDSLRRRRRSGSTAAATSVAAPASSSSARLLTRQQRRILDECLASEEAWRRFIELEDDDAAVQLTVGHVVALQLRTLLLERWAQRQLTADNDGVPRKKSRRAYSWAGATTLAETAGTDAQPVEDTASAMDVEGDSDGAQKGPVVNNEPTIPRHEPATGALLEQLFQRTAVPPVDDDANGNGTSSGNHHSATYWDVEEMLSNGYMTLDAIDAYEKLAKRAAVNSSATAAVVPPPAGTMVTPEPASEPESTSSSSSVTTTEVTSSSLGLQSPLPPTPASSSASAAAPAPAPPVAAQVPSRAAAPLSARTMSITGMHSPKFDSIGTEAKLPVAPRNPQDVAPWTNEAFQLSADSKSEGSGYKYFWDTVVRRSTSNAQVAQVAYDLKAVLANNTRRGSKWYDPHRAHQEELYLALENVIKVLTGNTFKNYSWPFLHPVSKKQAKDYDVIVKRPMSIETIQEKMQNIQYNNKFEFIEDLNLIVSNCYLYNGVDPANMYVRCANAFKKKIDQLAAKIPDVDVSDPSSHENDVPFEQFQQTPGAMPMTPHTPVSGSGGSSSGRYAPDVDINMFLNEEVQDAVPATTSSAVGGALLHDTTSMPGIASSTPAVAAIDAMDVSSSVKLEAVDAMDVVPVPDEEEPAVAEEEVEEEIEYNPNDTVQFGDAVAGLVNGIPPWFKFSSAQLEHLRTRRKQFAQSFAEQPAIVAKPADLAKYFDVELRRKRASVDPTLVWTAQQASIAAEWSPDLAGSIASLFPELTDGPVAPYLPLTTMSSSLKAAQAATLPKAAVVVSQAVVRAQPATALKLVQPTGYLNRIMYSNIGTLRDIRLLRFRIDNDTVQPGKVTLANLPAEFDANLVNVHPLLRGSLHPTASIRNGGVKEPAVPEPVVDNGALELDSQTARFALSQSIALMLQHDGFESVQTYALDVFTDVVGSFFDKFGRAFHEFHDAYSKKLSSDEILERSLAELGLEDLPAIETFWHDNIVKYRQKLLEAQRRLELRWLEVNGHEVPNEEAAVAGGEEDDVAFLSGNFTDDFGLDLLGLKEIGLGHLRVPSSLLNPKNKHNLVTHDRFRKAFTHIPVDSVVSPPPSQQPQEDDEIVEGGVAAGVPIVPMNGIGNSNGLTPHPSAESVVKAEPTPAATVPPAVLFAPTRTFAPIRSAEDQIGLLGALLREELAKSETGIVVEDVNLNSEQRAIRMRVSREYQLDDKPHPFDGHGRKPGSGLAATGKTTAKKRANDELL